MGSKELKAELRKQALARRDAIDPVSRIEMSLAVAEFAAPHIIFEPGTIIAGFLPIRSEIDLRPLMDILRQRGARLCLPVVMDKTTIVFRELVRGAALVDTGFGTSGPGPDATVLDPQILLMPLSVYDGQGNRIGYGAGHYDRAIRRLLAKDIQPQRIGFAFSVQEVDDVPFEDHDVPLDAIVTEKGFHRFRAGGKA
ncbi:MAG: 5-formyltetrahydrofolate cyclo-ligase [Nitratireductor sp.]|nr:5-formyltetrahydrofolate cyclo-ligase [Nitratireductor sp.]